MGAIIELLKAGADVNAADNVSDSCYCAFVLPCLGSLLQYGSTSLHAASECGHVRAITELLKAGANVNAADKVSDTREVHVVLGLMLSFGTVDSLDLPPRCQREGACGSYQ